MRSWLAISRDDLVDAMKINSEVESDADQPKFTRKIRSELERIANQINPINVQQGLDLDTVQTTKSDQ